MFIQPETATDNLFARQRAIFNCRVLEVMRNELLYDEILESMHERLGETVSILRSLSDFHCLQLEPSKDSILPVLGKLMRLLVFDGGRVDTEINITCKHNILQILLLQ